MRYSWFPLMLALSLMCGCDDKKRAGADEAPIDATAALVRDVQLKTSPLAMPPELVPSPQELRARVIATLNKEGAQLQSDIAPQGHTLNIRYGSQHIEAPNVSKKLVISIYGKLILPEFSNTYERTRAVMDIESIKAEQQRELFLEEFDALAQAVREDMQVHTSSMEEVMKAMEARPMLQPEPAVTAVRRLHEHVEAVPADRDRVAGIVRDHLTQTSPKALVALASLAAKLGDTSLGEPMVEAATQLAKTPHTEAYVAMLLQMGELGGGPIEAYLESVATGHVDPAIMTAGTSALNTARKRKAKQKKP